MKIIDKVKKFIKEKDLINSDDKILVGVSGGVDSVVLFSILLKLKASMDLELYVVHVNHGIRGANATRDEEFVKSLCDKNNISFSVICEDVPTFAKENKLSEEEAGRIIRRRSFEKIREEIGFDKIALAHHIDDNVETFFLNICRGSGISGGRGMNSKNGYYIRPFLCLTRSEIEEYAGENNIEHIEDETNLEDEYTRNKIRHNILPYLTKEINKNSICHINSFMERIAAVEEYFMENIDVKIKDILEYNDLLLKANFDKTVEERYSNIFNGSEPPHKILIPDNVLKGEPDFIQGEIIKECIFILTNKKKDITSRHIESVLELFTNFSGKKVDLPYNLEALRNYAGLEIREKKNKNSDKNRENIYTISCKKFPISDIKKPITYPLSPYTKWFDYDIIQGTLSICKWSYEDTFEYAKGKRKKINRFLIDEKVEKDKRDDVYLVSDEEDVLWVVGYRQSVKYQITDKTKTILEVNIVKN